MSAGGEGATAAGALAKKSGMKELREAGLELVLKGITTVDQVRRVVYTVEYR